MRVIDDLIIKEGNAISFGNYKLATKDKKEDFDFAGDIYKVKTYKDITKLEKNDCFLYESVPGTTVENFSETEHDVTFYVSGDKDPQITVGLEGDTEYCVFVNDKDIGCMKSSLAGKLSISIELDDETPVKVQIKKAK